MFQKLNKHKKHLQTPNDPMFRTLYNHLGNGTRKLLVVLGTTMGNIIKTIHRDSMQGHPGS